MMKIVIAISSFYAVSIPYSVWKYLTSPATYYVSSAGSNGNPGTIIAPFATATYALSVAVAGDNVLLKKGDVFNERINIPTSGTAGNTITISYYGSGANPQINAFENENSGWSDEGGNVWSKTISNATTNLNTVYINGALQPKARTPNTGFLTYIPASSHRNTTIAYIKTASLNGSEGYAGAELVLRDAAYIYDVNRILSQHIDTIFAGNCVTTPYSGGLQQFGFTYSPDSLATAARTQFFIQNYLGAVDTLNEWFWDSIPKKLYVHATSAPTDVKVSTRDTTVYANHKNYITFDGVDIIGANKMAFGLDTCDHVIHQNSAYNYIGAKAIDGRGSTNVTATSDSFLNIWSNGIWAERAFKKANFSNNYFKNIGTKAGMGLSNNQTYMAVWSDGDTCNISYNRGDSVGFNGIYIHGKRDTTNYNWFTNYCFVKDDGGGIVTYSLDYSGGLIRGNTLQHGIGTGGDAAAGIYLDASTQNITVDSNTVEDTKTYGIIVNVSATNVVLKNNTVVDSAAFCFYISSVNSFESKHNILYAKVSAQGRGVEITFSGSSLVKLSDSNYYICPTGESTMLKILGNIPYSLAGWVAALTWDLHTSGTPSNITSATGVLYVNPTDHDSTIVFSGIKKDATGALYLGSATIHSFQSKLLFTSYSNYINRIAGMLFN